MTTKTKKTRPLTAADGYVQEGDEFRCLNLIRPSRAYDWVPWRLGHHHSLIADMLKPIGTSTYEARRPIVEDGPTTKELLDWVTSLENWLTRGGVANSHKWYFNCWDADGRLYTGVGHTGRGAMEDAKKLYDKRHADLAAKEAQRQKDVAAFNTWLYSTCNTLVGSQDAYLAGLEAGRKEKA